MRHPRASLGSLCQRFTILWIRNFFPTSKLPLFYFKAIPNIRTTSTELWLEPHKMFCSWNESSCMKNRNSQGWTLFDVFFKKLKIWKLYFHFILFPQINVPLHESFWKSNLIFFTTVFHVQLTYIRTKNEKNKII